MTDIHRTLIIPLAQVAAARNLCDCLSPRGAGMFQTALSPTGAEPATHYISAGMVAEGFAQLAGNASAFHAAAQAGAQAQGKTLTATLQDAQDVLALSDITPDDPWAAMTRLGLTTVQSEL